MFIISSIPTWLPTQIWNCIMPLKRLQSSWGEPAKPRAHTYYGNNIHIIMFLPFISTRPIESLKCLIDGPNTRGSSSLYIFFIYISLWYRHRNIAIMAGYEKVLIKTFSRGVTQYFVHFIDNNNDNIVDWTLVM